MLADINNTDSLSTGTQDINDKQLFKIVEKQISALIPIDFINAFLCRPDNLLLKIIIMGL